MRTGWSILLLAALAALVVAAPVAAATKRYGSVASTAVGDLVAAGGRAGCGLVRYLPDGSPDLVFGSNGTTSLAGF
jgi:hypothetical protein